MGSLGYVVATVACMLPLTVMGQINVQTGGSTVNIGKDGGISVRAGGESKVDVRSKGSTAIATEGNVVGNSVGGIEGDVEMDGVAVINGRVYIDGKEIPPKVTRYKSPRSGEVYIIKRQGTSVQVVSESENNK